VGVGAGEGAGEGTGDQDEEVAALREYESLTSDSKDVAEQLRAELAGKDAQIAALRGGNAELRLQLENLRSELATCLQLNNLSPEVEKSYRVQLLTLNPKP